MSVFVTGAESFVGRALVSMCDGAEIPVTGIDRDDRTADRWGRVDIRDPELADIIPEGSTVVHLAAISRDPDCRADPREAFDVNVNGTLNVAEAARHRGCPQIIFASTEWVYGEVGNEGVQVEDQPIDATRLASEYALSKLVGERLLQLGGYVDVLTVLRFGIIYGPRSENFSAVEALLQRVQGGSTVEVGSARTARRFIHVDDIASGILASVGRSESEVLNLAGSDLVTLGDVVRASSLVLEREVELVESDPDRPSVRNPDNARALATLEWRPEVDLESGLRSVLHYLEGR